MSAIRSKDTKPELYLRKLLFAEGLRYRKNVERIPGCPDMFLAKYHTAVFVHGCYWHRHYGCKYAYTPKSRIDFWQNKFSSNIIRDTIVREKLQSMGIRCLTIWECTIRKMKKDEQFRGETLSRILCYIKQSKEGLTFLEL